MAFKMTQFVAPATSLVLLLVTLVFPIFSQAQTLIPAEKTALPNWVSKTFAPNRPGLDPELVLAEKSPVIIKVRQDGSGQFKTITEAVNSVPDQNTKRTIIWIGPGVYKEKVTVKLTQPFITFYGTPGKDLPKITFDGTAAKYGTLDSATVIVMSNYFVAANIIFENSSPEPDGKKAGAQAVALRIRGDKAAFYNCRFIGFQDTLCDDKGDHFFKDCYVEGTVDFIFGDGKSLYLATEIHAVSKTAAVITAQAREKQDDDSGFAFVHCLISGSQSTYLGRAWKAFAKVVFLYTDMGTVVNKEGWEHMASGDTTSDKTVFYGEFECKGPGADPTGRAKYVKKLTPAEAKTFLDISYIKGASWVLPPPSPK